MAHPCYPSPECPLRLPRHPCQRHPRIGPCRTSALDQLVWPDRGFSPPYEISYRGLKLPGFLRLLGGFELRREADLPLVRPSLRPIAIGPAQTPQGQALTPAFNLPARVGQRLGVSL
jgi:hypothetical protein